MFASAASILVDEISKIDLPDTWNPYRDFSEMDKLEAEDNGPEARRQRLLRWLQVEEAQVVIVCDYIGQAGSIGSGIPLVADSILSRSLLPRILPEEGFVSGRHRHTDVTSTMIWQTVLNLDTANVTLTFPLLPVVPVRNMSEDRRRFSVRALEEGESDAGLPFFRAMLAHHPKAILLPTTARSYQDLLRWAKTEDLCSPDRVVSPRASFRGSDDATDELREVYQRAERMREIPVP